MAGDDFTLALPRAGPQCIDCGQPVQRRPGAAAPKRCPEHARERARELDRARYLTPEYRERNRERDRERRRNPEYRERQRERSRERKRNPEYRERERERERERDRERRRNPEYRERERERSRERKRNPEYRERDRERDRERKRNPEYRERERERMRKRRAKAGNYRKLLVRLIVRQRALCALCGNLLPEDPADIHIDHVVPVARGGSSDPENLQAVCAACNLRKGGGGGNPQ